MAEGLPNEKRSKIKSYGGEDVDCFELLTAGMHGTLKKKFKNIKK